MDHAGNYYSSHHLADYTQAWWSKLKNISRTE